MKGAVASSTGPASRHLPLPWLKGNTPSKTHNYFGNKTSCSFEGFEAVPFSSPRKILFSGF